MTDPIDTGTGRVRPVKQSPASSGTANRQGADEKAKRQAAVAKWRRKKNQAAKEAKEAAQEQVERAEARERDIFGDAALVAGPDSPPMATASSSTAVPSQGADGGAAVPIAEPRDMASAEATAPRNAAGDRPAADPRQADPPAGETTQSQNGVAPDVGSVGETTPAAATAPEPQPAESERSNPQASADLPAAEILARLNEPVPNKDDDRAIRERFVTRQWEAEQVAGRWTGIFKRHIGLVLIGLKKEIGHGRWERYVENAYHAGTLPFQCRTAVEYMTIARETTDEEVQGHTAQDILVKLGRVSSNADDILTEGIQKFKAFGKTLIQLGQPNSRLLGAARKCRDPEIIDALRQTIGEIKISLDSLDLDLQQKQQIAQDWVAHHGPGEAA